MKKLLFLKGNAPYSSEATIKRAVSEYENLYSVDVVKLSDYTPDIICGYDAIIADILPDGENESIKNAVKALKLYSKVTLTANNESNPIIVEPIEKRISGTAEGSFFGREVVREERISFIEIEKTLRTAYGIAERSTRTVTDAIDKDSAYELVLVIDKESVIDKAYVTVFSEIIYDYKDVVTKVESFEEYLKNFEAAKGRVVVSPSYSSAIKAFLFREKDLVHLYTGRDDRCLVSLISGTPYLTSDTASYDEAAEYSIRFLKELYL